jgi:hypothetical protein
VVLNCRSAATSRCDNPAMRLYFFNLFGIRLRSIYSKYQDDGSEIREGKLVFVMSVGKRKNKEFQAKLRFLKQVFLPIVMIYHF